MTKVPVEVALLMKVGAGPQNTSSNVTPVLLEWFDSVNELIMVFERQKKNHRFGCVSAMQKQVSA